MRREEEEEEEEEEGTVSGEGGRIATSKYFYIVREKIDAGHIFHFSGICTSISRAVLYKVTQNEDLF